MAGKKPETNGEANGEAVVVPPGREEPYSDYLYSIYRDRILGGTLPIASTDPNQLEEAARQTMSQKGFNYVSGGAGECATMDANRLAFRQWKLVPRMMRPTVPRDLRVTLFGETYDSPVVMAPVGVQDAFHEEKELGTAAACAELGVPFTVSSAGSSTIEEIAARVKETEDGNGKLWFQLYWPTDDEITASMLRRAREAGCKVLLVTLDTSTISWRPKDLDIAFMPFATGQGDAVGFSDPVFRRKFAAATGGETPETAPLMAAAKWTTTVFPRDAHRWEDLAVLRRLWDGPMVLKGILHPEDARLAVEHGADGVLVSNHGGRQVDGSVAALEMLPEVVAAVGDKVPVLFDSGVRTGADIMKALCLGARAVLVGRPVIYGLGIAGRRGARHVLAGLLADLDQSMNLSGVKTVAELDQRMLRKVAYGGDLKSSL